MQEPGDRRPASQRKSARPSTTGRGSTLVPRSRAATYTAALLVAALAALAWGLLKGILEFGPALLGVAIAGGWAIGALLAQVRASALLAAAIGALAWLLGLLLTWLIAMAILPGSSRTFLERVEGTPFLEWLAPQFGLLEIAGLLLYVLAALFGARPRRSAG